MDVTNITALAGMAIFAYLLGAVPFGLILLRRFKSVDLRQTGSGNIGATNARRAGGWRLALATLFLDALKGAVPVCLTGWGIGCPSGTAHSIAVGIAAISACCGHMFPIYLKFKTGGKGVATAAGAFIVISPLSLLIALAVFIFSAGLANRVSVGSLAACAVLPPSVLIMERSWILAGCAASIAILVVIRHRENIRRLRTGTEPMLR